jgi:2-amino-4-hydroxy-6-hydroxymethyldihydropteridine diphosphokinase
MIKSIINLNPSKSEEEFVLLSLGTNMGDRRENIEFAYEYLITSGTLSNAVMSSFYETEPVGILDQNDFLNVAIAGYTKLTHFALLQACKSIEYMIGREVRKRWHEREIDIDIIAYGSYEISNKHLIIPHPRMHKRRFVLVPCAEIAGNYVHPSLGLTLNELLDECPDTSEVHFFA